MGLMKLIGTDEERKKLSQNHTDHTTGGEKLINKMEVIFKDFSEDAE